MSKLAKVGDKVRCIDAADSGIGFPIIEGQIYIVVRVDDYEYHLQGVSGVWYYERFEVVKNESTPTPKYVKCVNCDNAYKNLTFGKVYEILDEVDDKWLIVSDNGSEVEWYKWRFEPYDPPSHIVTNKTNSSTLDHEEERVRSLFFGGVSRELCVQHSTSSM